uniref:hypothetical protein n=1 Tax=Flavobacterium sp. TaxID=239 RepID=UPI00404B5AF2
MNYNINPSFGLGVLLFGMQVSEVEKLLGKASSQTLDAEQNKIHTYNELQIRLTFYAEEDFKLGYITSNHPALHYKNKPVIGVLTSEVKKIFSQMNAWETTTDEDFITHHFNENYWIDLQEEFLRITKIELGATIKNLDEFDWKFPKK